MDLIQDTTNAINKKIASLQVQENKWRETQSGFLEKWQEYRLKEGIEDIQRLQALLVHIQQLRYQMGDAQAEIVAEMMQKNWYQKLTTFKDYRDTLLDRLDRAFAAFETKYEKNTNPLKKIYYSVLVTGGFVGVVKDYRQRKNELK